MPSARSILLQNSKNHLAILRLNFFTFKFEAKFVNLTHRDPYPENVKFTFSVRQRQINLHAVQQPLTCSGVREGLGEEEATLRK